MRLRPLAEQIEKSNMLPNEAEWLGQSLGRIAPRDLSPMINLGSSSEEFRKKTQPHIHNLTIGPLLDSGVEIVHSDLFEGDGVDVAGSIFDTDILRQLRAVQPNSVVCANMFEHVEDRGLLALSLDSLLREGGYLAVTVPNSFPYHPDPIDNYFRPSIDEIKQLFPGYEEIYSNLVSCGTLLGRYRTDRAFMLRQIVGCFLPLPSPRKWVRNLHHCLWAVRPYKTACVILRKN